MSKRRYFGTDGIRGTANKGAIRPCVALRIGQAVGQVLRQRSRHVRPSVVIGKDTRLSGYMLESALQAGFTSVGFYSLQVGPLPTPAVAMLTRTLRADCGVMITASHNPHEDNGIKIFTPGGDKLPNDMVDQIEALIDDPDSIELASPDKIGKAVRVDDAVGRYVEFCKASVGRDFDLNGQRVVIDCANGATYKMAPKIFWELGAQVVRVGAEPDGFNINRGCGATSPEKLQKAVVQHGAQLGIALDGDGDRLIMVDDTGQVIDGDMILGAMGAYYKEKGTLTGGGIVGTVMANMGLEKFLESQDLTLTRTAVGDHNVEKAMREGGFNLGGEPNGHLIFGDYVSSGDGILAALQVCEMLKETRRSASSIRKIYEPFPQTLENIRLPEGSDAGAVLESDDVQGAIQQSSDQLNGSGRVLVRKSGTEPVIRIMVEAADEALVQQHIESLSATVNKVVAA